MAKYEGQRLLLVVTSADTMGDTDQPTGLHLGELPSLPRDVGFGLDIANA